MWSDRSSSGELWENCARSRSDPRQSIKETKEEVKQIHWPIMLSKFPYSRAPTNSPSISTCLWMSDQILSGDGTMVLDCMDGIHETSYVRSHLAFSWWKMWLFCRSCLIPVSTMQKFPISKMAHLRWLLMPGSHHETLIQLHPSCCYRRPEEGCRMSITMWSSQTQ